MKSIKVNQIIKLDINSKMFACVWEREREVPLIVENINKNKDAIVKQISH